MLEQGTGLPNEFFRLEPHMADILTCETLAQNLLEPT